MSLTALLLAVSLASEANAPSPAEAVRLYDEGQYAEAGALLRGLDGSGVLDGSLLYRLFFCERANGNEGAAQTALDRARQALEKENAASASLEVPFYLANTYANMGRRAEARTVAAAATGSLESGALKEPNTGIGYFQVGKLYQDQGRQEDAVRWYTRAIDAFDPKGPRYTGSLRWALRYTGSVAAAAGDLAGSETAFRRLTQVAEASAGDWSALAVAAARLGKYAEASDAWRKAVQLDPQNADDPRYAARVALVAAQIAPLPKVSVQAKAYKTMTAEELEGVMKNEAATARGLHERAAAAMAIDADGVPTVSLASTLRATLTSELNAAQGRFFASALEYAMRGLPIRETAFREGYAVLVFQDREWEIPSDSAP